MLSSTFALSPEFERSVVVVVECRPSGNLEGFVAEFATTSFLTFTQLLCLHWFAAFLLSTVTQLMAIGTAKSPLVLRYTKPDAILDLLQLLTFTEFMNLRTD